MTRGRRTPVSFGPRRELLLTEITRRCKECEAAARVGLTKEEARTYHGFECGRCEAWNDDELVERDIPEWWEELRVTGLYALRPREDAAAALDDGAPGAISRLSDAWRREINGADESDGDL